MSNVRLNVRFFSFLHSVVNTVRNVMHGRFEIARLRGTNVNPETYLQTRLSRSSSNLPSVNLLESMHGYNRTGMMAPTPMPLQNDAQSPASSSPPTGPILQAVIDAGLTADGAPSASTSISQAVTNAGISAAGFSASSDESVIVSLDIEANALAEGKSDGLKKKDLDQLNAKRRKIERGTRKGIQFNENITVASATYYPAEEAEEAAGAQEPVLSKTLAQVYADIETELAIAAENLSNFDARLPANDGATKMHYVSGEQINFANLDIELAEGALEGAQDLLDDIEEHQSQLSPAKLAEFNHYKALCNKLNLRVSQARKFVRNKCTVRFQ